MAAIEDHHIYGLQVRESADDGSDFTNPDADYRIVFLGEDGLLHAKDSAGTVTGLGGTGLTNPMTTAEDIIYGGASGTPTRKAKGSDGTFLGVASGTLGYAAVTDALLSTSDITTNNASTTKHGFAPKYPNDATKYLDGTGAYSVPAGGGGGGGGLVFLEAHTAATSATLDFTSISSTYVAYMLVFEQLVPSTNADSIYLRMGTGAGPTYDSTAGHYAYVGVRNSNTAGASGGSTSTTFIGLDGGSGAEGVSSTASNGGMSGKFVVVLGGGSAFTTVRGESEYWGSINTLPVVGTASGAFLQTTAVTALRVLASTGNLASGTVRMYGLAKS